MAKSTDDVSEKELLREISRKLDRLAGIIAMQGKELDDQVRILTSYGFASAEIGVIVGKHADHVRRIRSQRKKASRRRRPSK